MKALSFTAAVGLALLLQPGSAPAQDATAIAQGARAYARNCGRCHNLRAATERTDREWVAIMNHMRVRAMLSRSQTQAITTFLQATNGPEGGRAARPDPAGPPQAAAQVETEDAPEPKQKQEERSPDRPGEEP